MYELLRSHCSKQCPRKEQGRQHKSNRQIVFMQTTIFIHDISHLAFN